MQQNMEKDTETEMEKETEHLVHVRVSRHCDVAV